VEQKRGLFAQRKAGRLSGLVFLFLLLSACQLPKSSQQMVLERAKVAQQDVLDLIALIQKFQTPAYFSSKTRALQTQSDYEDQLALGQDYCYHFSYQEKTYYYREGATIYHCHRGHYVKQVFSTEEEAHRYFQTKGGPIASLLFSVKELILKELKSLQSSIIYSSWNEYTHYQKSEEGTHYAISFSDIGYSFSLTLEDSFPVSMTVNDNGESTITFSHASFTPLYPDLSTYTEGQW
jgi:hypothetical protein